MVSLSDQAFSQTANISVDAYKHHKAPKSYERYEFSYQKMKSHLLRNPMLRFIDIGCGDGGFIFYLKKRHPDIAFYGLEPNDELIEHAKKIPALKGVCWLKGDVSTFKLKEKVDLFFMSGVLSIFDDIEVPIRNVMRHVVPGGRGYIFGGFCSQDIDVLVRYRNNYLHRSIWESGLNMFSLETVRKVLRPYSSKINMCPFKIKTNLKNQKDPIRSYTLSTHEKGRIIVNGANIIRDFYLIEIVKNQGGKK